MRSLAEPAAGALGTDEASQLHEAVVATMLAVE